jgi:hypothetical protein
LSLGMHKGLWRGARSYVNCDEEALLLVRLSLSLSLSFKKQKMLASFHVTFIAQS